MSIQNLPPEMQARIAAIMAGNAPAGEAPQAPQAQPSTEAPAPVTKPPSLVDHVVCLRQEVGHLHQQNAAVLQTLEAVGQAVASLYEMFQPTQQQTYSSAFTQPQTQDQEDF